MYKRADSEILKIAKKQFRTGRIRQALAFYLQSERRFEVADYLVKLIARTTRW